MSSRPKTTSASRHGCAGRTTIQRVAVIFDNTVRPETTGLYCRRALGQLVHNGELVEVEHFRPDELDRVPQGRFDLFVIVDDGLPHDVPEWLRPSVFWAIDTHVSFDRCLAIARKVDLTFAAQRDGARRLQESGIGNVEWLPLACDPELHGRQPTDKQYDVCFVGNIFPGERAELVQLLFERYPRSFVGRRYFEEMAAVYSASRTVFNRSLDGDINMRVFEGLCSGSLLVTNALDAQGQPELFRDGVHLATYTDRDELLGKLEFYLRNDTARERIAAAGRAEVLARHTYRHRMETILHAAAKLRSSADDGDCCPDGNCIQRNGKCRCNSKRCRRRRQKQLRRTDLRPLVPSHAASSPATTSDRQTGHTIRSAVATKDPAYFEFDRPDVLELVPLSARRILDVGCGGGRLGAALKARQDCDVVGIELSAGAAAHARSWLDQVVVANIETDDVPFDSGEFDCVICADVLEHLREPAVILQKLRWWLAPAGCLIASIPNVRNHTVIQSLLAGNWTYESAGLLDADHVRFFTRREIEKLLFRCGFDIDELRMVPGEGFDDWVERGRPRLVSVGGLQIRAESEAVAQEFFAYQWLTRAVPVTRTDDGLTSIILVTHNQLPYTKACLDSIRLRTDEPYELIVVDNGSTDGTVEYLQSLHDVRLVVNDSNRGFPAAVNQGIAVAQGQQVLLLNNDTIVTTGWLRRMLDVLHSEPAIGLVGPVSNNVSGEQQIAVGYAQLADLDGWAWDRQRQFLSGGPAAQLAVIETDRLIGFCLLIRREVLDQIGVLDERFGIGCFEDDDLCRRAIRQWYKVVIASAAFVHHFGSATFRGSGVDLGDVLRCNRRVYEEKWGEEDSGFGIQDSGKPTGHRAPTSPRPTHDQRPTTHSPSIARPQYVIAQHPDGGLLLKPNTLRLSVCLIVRDNERTIRPCLESIRPWVDEIVVVDTGSTDATPVICEELGARVFHWAWRDDFAAARNVSLNHARGEWLFWMDSDDTIPDECGRKLRALVDGPHPEHILGYVMQVHCPGTDPTDVTVVDHVKLIRNRPDLRFEFRIHEQVLPSIRRAGGEVQFTDIYVVHSGYDRSDEGQARKLDRDFRLLQLELQDRPEHPFVLFNLGMTCADCGRITEAIDYLELCLTVSQPEESHVRKAYALLVSALSRDGENDRAVNWCDQGLRLFPDDKELLFRRAMLHHEQGELTAAAATYRRILEEPVDRHFTSVDTGIAGIKARHNLALVYEDLGDDESAATEWERILHDEPSYAPAWRGRAEALLRLGWTSEVLQLRSALAAQSDARLGHLIPYLSGRLAESVGDIDDAVAAYAEADQLQPSETAALHRTCRLLFAAGRWERACESLEQLAVRASDDASVFHNLGVARWLTGDVTGARRVWQTSLDLRPAYAETERLLQETRTAYVVTADRLNSDAASAAGESCRSATRVQDPIRLSDRQFVER